MNPLPLGEKEHPGGGPKVSHLPDNVCPETPGFLEASTPLLVYLRVWVIGSLCQNNCLHCHHPRVDHVVDLLIWLATVLVGANVHEAKTIPKARTPLDFDAILFVSRVALITVFK